MTLPLRPPGDSELAFLAAVEVPAERKLPSVSNSGHFHRRARLACPFRRRNSPRRLGPNWHRSRPHEHIRRYRFGALRRCCASDYRAKRKTSDNLPATAPFSAQIERTSAVSCAQARRRSARRRGRPTRASTSWRTAFRRWGQCHYAP